MVQKEIWYKIKEKLPEKEGLYLVTLENSQFKRISTYKDGKFSLDNVAEWSYVSIEKAKK